jgi:hypothetical protein
VIIIKDFLKKYLESTEVRQTKEKGVNVEEKERQETEMEKSKTRILKITLMVYVCDEVKNVMAAMERALLA